VVVWVGLGLCSAAPAHGDRSTGKEVAERLALTEEWSGAGATTSPVFVLAPEILVSSPPISPEERRFQAEDRTLWIPGWGHLLRQPGAGALLRFLQENGRLVFFASWRDARYVAALAEALGARPWRIFVNAHMTPPEQFFRPAGSRYKDLGVVKSRWPWGPAVDPDSLVFITSDRVDGLRILEHQRRHVIAVPEGTGSLTQVIDWLGAAQARVAANRVSLVEALGELGYSLLPASAPTTRQVSVSREIQAGLTAPTANPPTRQQPLPGSLFKPRGRFRLH
jgi:hypothetical protein